MTRRSIYFLFAILFFTASCNPDDPSKLPGIPSDSLTIAKGKIAFSEKCASCHSMHMEGIGPRLAGTTTAHSLEWIKKFIKNPQQMIDSGDTTAKKLFDRYKAVMPSFAHLPEEELNAIIAYIHEQKPQQTTTSQIDTNDIKDPIPDTIETSDVIVDVRLVTQIPASSKDALKTRIIKFGFEPGSGERYVLDLRGKLYKLVNNRPVVFLDMPALRKNFVDKPGMATGFGSFAFHPAFVENGLLYTTHNEAPGSGVSDFVYADSIPVEIQAVLTEWRIDQQSQKVVGNGREILRVNLPSGVHGVQEIAFNPDAGRGSTDYGLLYIGIGDGGSVILGKPLVTPLPSSVWGSILRIDPLGKNSKNGKYGIPADNPFSAGNVEAEPALFAYGFRNPHRFSWTKSGKLLASNIGEHHIEALYQILPGRFYGWPIREGTFTERFFNETGKIFPLPEDDSTFHITYPVAQFDHDEGTAIVGGYEYRGRSIPMLKGKYLFGDIATGRLFFVNVNELETGSQAEIKEWNISSNGKRTSLAELCGNPRVDMRLGIDKEGEMYLMTKFDGKMYKLVDRK